MFNKNKTRREFIQSSGIATAGVLAASRLSLAGSLSHVNHDIPVLVNPEQLPESDEFSLGVASGDVTSDQAILWTHYTGENQLGLALFKSNHSNSKPQQIGFFKVEPKDGFVHIDIDGLSPKTSYQYLFAELENGSLRPISKSAFGHFRTAIAPNSLEPVTLGASCCTFNAFEPTVLSDASENSALDAFLLLGDTSYNDGCQTLRGFRDRWASNLGKDSYLRLRSKMPVIATWDDHEVANNFDPETTDPTTLANARRTFFEHLPVRRHPLFPNRLWRRFTYGKTVELIVLDCRMERKPSTRGSTREEYISFAQMEWLKSTLKQSSAIFKVIMNSVPITEFPFGDKTDRWQGYPSQRQEILSFIDQERIPGVLWVSGDFHFGCLGLVSSSGPGQKAIEVLAGPGGQIANPLGMGLKLSSRFEWVTLRNNYLTLTFDPKGYTINVVHHVTSRAPQDPWDINIMSRHEKILQLPQDDHQLQILAT